MSDGVDVLDWLAMVLLLGLGILIAFLLWPYHNYRFRFDPNELLQQHVDTERPSTLDEMHRNLAVRIESDRTWNWRIIQRLRVGLQVALVLLVIEILAWLGSIANST